MTSTIHLPRLPQNSSVSYAYVIYLHIKYVVQLKASTREGTYQNMQNYFHIQSVYSLYKIKSFRTVQWRQITFNEKLTIIFCSHRNKISQETRSQFAQLKSMSEFRVDYLKMTHTTVQINFVQLPLNENFHCFFLIISV